MLARAKVEPESVPTFVQSIVTAYPNFDAMTKSKTIETLSTSKDVRTQQAVVNVLGELIERPGTSDVKVASDTRRVVADHLTATIRSCSFPDTSENALSAVRSMTMSILDLLARHAFFVFESGQIQVPVPPMSDASRTMLRSRISSALGHLLAKDPDPSYHPCELVWMLQKRSDDRKSGARASVSTDPRVQKTIRQGLRMIERFHVKDQYKEIFGLETCRAFALLFSLTILQVYNGDTDATNVLGDLLEVSKDMLETDSPGNHPEASQVLVEIILSFASKPSILFRRLSQQVFRACSSMINADGLSSMLEVRWPVRLDSIS